MVNPVVELSISGTIMPPFSVVVLSARTGLTVSITVGYRVPVPFRTTGLVVLNKISNADLEDDIGSVQHPLLQEKDG